MAYIPGHDRSQLLLLQRKPRNARAVVMDGILGRVMAGVPLLPRHAAPLNATEPEAMLADRGVEVDHTTMYRWVQRFAPELEKRMRRHLRPCRGPWYVDETYIRVSGQCRYLYRAFDGTGQTIDFLLSAKRDKTTAKRFFKRALGREYTRNPREIVTDRLT